MKWISPLYFQRSAKKKLIRLRRLLQEKAVFKVLEKFETKTFRNFQVVVVVGHILLKIHHAMQEQSAARATTCSVLVTNLNKLIAIHPPAPDLVTPFSSSDPPVATVEWVVNFDHHDKRQSLGDIESMCGIRGTDLVVVSTRGRIHCVDITLGKLVWEQLLVDHIDVMSAIEDIGFVKMGETDVLLETEPSSDLIVIVGLGSSACVAAGHNLFVFQGVTGTLLCQTTLHLEPEYRGPYEPNRFANRPFLCSMVTLEEESQIFIFNGQSLSSFAFCAEQGSLTLLWSRKLYEIAQVKNMHGNLSLYDSRDHGKEPVLIFSGNNSIQTYSCRHGMLLNKVTLPTGRGKNTALMVNQAHGKLFAACHGWVYAYSLPSLDTMWTFHVNGTANHWSLELVGDSLVLVSAMKLACVSQESGKLDWIGDISFMASSKAHSKVLLNHHHGIMSMVKLNEESVLVAGLNHIGCISVKDGHVAWLTSLGDVPPWHYSFGPDALGIINWPAVSNIGVIRKDSSRFTKYSNTTTLHSLQQVRKRKENVATAAAVTSGLLIVPMLLWIPFYPYFKASFEK